MMALPSSPLDASFDLSKFTRGIFQPVAPDWSWAPERREMVMFLKGGRYNPRPPRMETFSLRQGRKWERVVRLPGEAVSVRYTQILTEVK